MQRGVIVADDSIIIRDNVRAALGEPWRIFLAANGAEAVEYARGIKAELVLLDFRMPRMDGLDACSVIRTMANYATVPIVLLTAYDNSKLRGRAAGAGATAVLAKPFTTAQLREAILPLIALGRDAAAQRTRSGMPDALTAPNAEGFDGARDVLAVYRKVDQAAEQRRSSSFAETMAARRARALR
jgi:CheY-like chemotaxis protein